MTGVEDGQFVVLRIQHTDGQRDVHSLFHVPGNQLVGTFEGLLRRRHLLETHTKDTSHHDHHHGRRHTSTRHVPDEKEIAVRVQRHVIQEIPTDVRGGIVVRKHIKVPEARELLVDQFFLDFPCFLALLLIRLALLERSIRGCLNMLEYRCNKLVRLNRFLQEFQVRIGQYFE